MTNAEQYCAQAAAQRALAEKSELLNRRLMHEQSARMWDEMALSAEDTIERSLVNAAPRLQKPDWAFERHNLRRKQMPFALAPFKAIAEPKGAS